MGGFILKLATHAKQSRDATMVWTGRFKTVIYVIKGKEDIR